MSRKYSAAEFASLLGISKSSLLDKERKGVLPKPGREVRGSTSYRYYLDEDIPGYRKLLNTSPPLKRKRIQLFLSCQHGTGKSSLAANYVQYASSLGIRTLAIDLDQKGDFSAYLYPKNGELHTTIGQILLADGAIDGAVIAINKYLNLLPGNIMLAPASLELNSRASGEFLLQNALRKVSSKYDLIVMDVSSQPDILMKNAILAAQDIIIPVTPTTGAQAVRITMELIRQVEAENSGVNLKHIFLANNLAVRSFKISAITKNSDILSAGVSLCNTVIRFDTRYETAGKKFRTVVDLHPRSGVTRDIRELTKELLFDKRTAMTKPVRGSAKYKSAANFH